MYVEDANGQAVYVRPSWVKLLWIPFCVMAVMIVLDFLCRLVLKHNMPGFWVIFVILVVIADYWSWNRYGTTIGPQDVQRTIDKGLCPHCGHDILHTGGMCNECGHKWK